jgi:hypothetical protein
MFVETKDKTTINLLQVTGLGVQPSAVEGQPYRLIAMSETRAIIAVLWHGEQSDCYLALHHIHRRLSSNKFVSLILAMSGPDDEWEVSF